MHSQTESLKSNHQHEFRRLEPTPRRPRRAPAERLQMLVCCHRGRGSVPASVHLAIVGFHPEAIPSCLRRQKRHRSPLLQAHRPFFSHPPSYRGCQSPAARRHYYHRSRQTRFHPQHLLHPPHRSPAQHRWRRPCRQHRA